MPCHFNFFSDQTKAVWSGGTTTQLCIYPFDELFAERGFIFRISTATVETETSDFTGLPGFHRVLMILEGNLTIHHKDRYSKHLLPFDTDEFEGAWQTSAEGRVTDFNVIYSDKVKQVHVQKLELQKGEQFPERNENDFTGVYILSGSMEINNRHLGEKDFVLLQRDDTKFNITNNCICILAIVIMG